MSQAQAQAQATPFASRPLFEATRRDELALALESTYGAEVRALERDEAQMFARANRVQVGDVHLHYCRYDAPVEIEFSQMPGVRQMLCLTGRGRVAVSGRTLEVDPTTSGLIPAGSSFKAGYGGQYQHIVAQFDPVALRRRAEALIGASLPGDLGLDAPRAAAAGRQVRSQQIAYAMSQILASGAAEIDLAMVELAQALSSAFLIDCVEGFSDRLAERARPPGRSSVARLEAYIEDHWNQAITVEDVATACGVSARSVFARFKQQRGVAPLTFLRDIRLDRAREALLDPEGPGSVIDVALACGFASFGHFARRYRDRFGELPSATRARRPFTT